MHIIMYREEEVYLSNAGVNHVEGAHKAMIARGLIKRLLNNGQSKDARTEVALSRCMTTLNDAIDNTINDLIK